VADQLGIPDYVFDVEQTRTHDVIDEFVAEYTRAPTRACAATPTRSSPEMLVSATSMPSL
jgi:hypothetical protein